MAGCDVKGANTRPRPTRKARILVLDADLVSALTVVRSLIRQRYIVHVASACETPIAAFSKGVAGCYRYPDPLRCEAPFLAWLQDRLERGGYDLVIPVSERTLVPLAAHRRHFVCTNLAMADTRSLQGVLDKAETFKLAATLGVCIPDTHYLTDPARFDAIASELSYPVVIKPARSVAPGRTGYSKHNVSYATTKEGLENRCGELLGHGPVLLQSYFAGQGVGIELIASKGEILYTFQHHRLHQLPLTGGGSSLRVSTEVEPELLEATTRLVRALDWSGVAMVEFKWNPANREYRLMEINGRLWGSLPLAVAAGADFPAMLAELHLTGTLGEYPAYRRGIYCRNLASDLMWHEQALRSQSTPLAPVPGVGEIGRDLALVLSPRHYFDTQSWRDPLPGVVELGRIVAGYSGRLATLVGEKRFAAHQRMLWRNGTVRERIREAHSLLFVCHGNINRSAVAEVMMTSLLPEGCNKRVMSAGFHHHAGRPADERMVKIAAECGIDLSASRSTCVSANLLTASDVIFVMEKAHRDRLLIIAPDVADRVFLLGPGAGRRQQWAAEIPDPYNLGERVYRAAFRQIRQAVTALGDAVRLDHGH